MREHHRPSLRYELIDRLRCRPSLYLPLARRFRRDPAGRAKTIDDDTGLVIEAFPRSGSTFARVAFESAQPQPVRLAHHLHAPAQVIAAAKRTVPCLVLLRNPDDAALSLILREPRLTLTQALRSHARFHAAIEPYLGRILLARFESVTTDFGRVIDALNRRFNTGFAPFDHTPEAERACHATLDAHEHALGKPEPMRSRPTPERQMMKDQLRAQLDEPRTASARAAARVIYERLAPTAV